MSLSADTSNNLLGTIGTGSDGGFQFVGFESTGALIGRALIQDIKLNSSVVTVDNLIVQPVPLPAALPLFASGLAGLGWLARRRNRMSA